MSRLCTVLIAMALLVGPSGTVRALDSEEHTLMALINDYRQANGSQPVEPSDQLMAAAEWMSNDMAANSYKSHTDSLGRYTFQRMDSFGYDAAQANGWRGENLVVHTSTAQATLDAMKASPEHNANMLTPDYEVVGIARASDASRTWYWTVDFGGRKPIEVAPKTPMDLPHTGTDPSIGERNE